MKIIISQELTKIFNDAMEYARQEKHRYLTIEHMFYCLFDNENIQLIFKKLNINTQSIQNAIEQYFDHHMEKVSQIDTVYRPTETLSLSKSIDEMFLNIKNSNRKEAVAIDMFFALFLDKNSYSYKILKSLKIPEQTIIKIIDSSEIKKQRIMDDIVYEYLDKYCTNITKLAKENKIDPVINRDEEILQTMQTLCRRRKNNPILIGEAGVGKTAIVEGLAEKLLADNAPDILKNNTLYSLNIGNLIAGTKYRGDFEKRIKSIIDELMSIKTAILFIDEIHTIIGAGSVNDNAIDAANILKPYLARGDIKCIGATTYEEYKNHFIKDKAMNRRFAKIDIKEPSIEDTFLILKGIKQKYQDFHKIKYSDKILKNIISLSDEYIKDRFLPDKAIDILDEVGSRYWVRDKKSKTVTTQDIEQVISKMSNTPIKSINTQDKKILKTLSKKLKKKIFAQDDAIDTICQSILISKAGLKRKNKPIASFLFTGESGIGKTQLAHELAHELNISFERFDMSEFMEQHSISKLIGAPAGYVGFDDGGQLTDVVKKNPHAVILLDEIEKANKELLNILLGVMDNASLKDSKGQKVDFSHIILIMTSNITSNDAKSMGFGQDSSLAGDRNIKEFFNKEFLNRLTDIIYFKPLDKTNIYKIIDKFIYSLLENIQEKNLDIEIDMSIKKEIYKQANVQTYGARNIEKVVDDLISYQLAKTLIFNKQITKSKMIIKYIDNQTLIEAG